VHDLVEYNTKQYKDNLQYGALPHATRVVYCLVDVAAVNTSAPHAQQPSKGKKRKGALGGDPTDEEQGVTSRPLLFESILPYQSSAVNRLLYVPAQHLGKHTCWTAAITRSMRQ